MTRKKIEYENEEFLTNQIITYIGNKRSLLEFIGEAIELIKNKEKKGKIKYCRYFLRVRKL